MATGWNRGATSWCLLPLERPLATFRARNALCRVMKRQEHKELLLFFINASLHASSCVSDHFGYLVHSPHDPRRSCTVVGADTFRDIAYLLLH